MWALDNRTAYASERSWTQDKDGGQYWIVVVKATYDIRPDGSTEVAEKQEPIVRIAVHRGDPASSSLIYEADIVGRKIGTDVLVNGAAYAPRGRRVTSLEVRVRAGSIDKTLLVTGNRRWYAGAAGVTRSEAEPFDTMPITYERAFGGYDRSDPDPAQHRLYDRNPVGTGFAVRASHLHDQPVPNIEYPSQRIRDWTERPLPAGLGPIPRWWSPRREHAGTYDQRWVNERMPLWATDFDDRYHQSAPPDQQVSGFLRGGEVVELTNLTPTGVLRFALPKVHLGYTTFFGADQHHHVGQLDAVIIEPDKYRVMLVWQTLLACHHDVDYLDMTRVVEKRVVSTARSGPTPSAGGGSA
jgi:hypothetical protein